ncbi:MAG: T9SS type A sorting domain-containing protein [candidate division KSB1 bacterium]|nr:T9SS type A sorting domain-containing protein [candidate division KSB1 bacterium]MDZ7377799.1 T9SS type A sorting domain-containing protein [candidate division KSB1 bacterium]MDZ7385927.1 T9SS type A sorting domain-containing protein [candidate division KSB1 bacterium]MDZ7393423.1 T9SS type A sorting domain-containing protein [candidate division KSB1 bacterium]MDZ7413481.1 T9SS type A sorting domain-containing protein [candidate division KSB1 bacterium]
MSRELMTTVFCLVLAAAVSGGELHLTATPAAPAVGSEFAVAVCAKGLGQVIAVDLRFALDSLAVRVLGIEPVALSRFEWLRWKVDAASRPSITALMLSSPSNGVSFADGDTLALLRCMRIGAQGTLIGLKAGHPVAIAATMRELPCIVFPATLAQASGVPRTETGCGGALRAYVSPNPGFERASLVVNSPTRVNQATWSLYDVTGRLVWTQTFMLPEGTSRLSWEGVNASGRRLPAGTYFYRLQTPSQELKGKCVLLR